MTQAQTALCAVAWFECPLQWSRSVRPSLTLLLLCSSHPWPGMRHVCKFF